MARRLDRTPVVDGVYRLDEGALWDDFVHVRQERGGVDVWERVRGTALERAMGPVGPDRLRDGLQPRCGVASMHALPALRRSAEALRRLVGFKATQGREGVCRRSHAKRPGAKAPGPICPDTLATKIVTRHVRALEALCHGVSRALAPAGVFGATVTGSGAGTALEPTAPDAGCGHVPRTRQRTDTHGTGRAIAGTGYGWKLMAVRVVPMHAPAGLARRALVT